MQWQNVGHCILLELQELLKVILSCKPSNVQIQSNCPKRLLVGVQIPGQKTSADVTTIHRYGSQSVMKQIQSDHNHLIVLIPAKRKVDAGMEA